MSDLLTILQEIQDKAYGWRGENEVFIQAILTDGRIGVLPTRSELFRVLDFYGLNRLDYRQDTITHAIVEGYAREDPQEEPMLAHIDDRIAEAREAIERKYAPDQDSAAVDAIAKVINQILWLSPQGGLQLHSVARAVRAHLRDHPEDVGIPVMTASEIGDRWMCTDHDSVRSFLSELGQVIVIPDPPAAEPVPERTVEVTLSELQFLVHMAEDSRTFGEDEDYAITRKMNDLIAKAAQGRADDGA